ncbi:DUF4261 domain-containing protein [Epilithonimonas zeae]|uniref:DUF4261 domain-containing protein n=1 Tax=Epilithonimonas zeae TaxID=1416779 RepID=UPI00200BEB11|nr:DUF4261 domain-containing protein [Epilithonimonas zeae]UQB69976.1 DUF4261 domain-containing protein [Epilithonimonas zeae]
MGLFDIFKKKEERKENQESRILLAMPMFVNGDRYELNAIVDHLKNYWNLAVTDIDGDDETAILNIDDEKVAIAFMPIAIPIEDITGTAQYAYNWPTVLDEVKNSTGHSIVSVLSGTKTDAERFKLLSKILHSILTTSNSIGIYQGSQTLLIPKEQYLESAENLKNDATPVNLWVYIGLRESEEGNSVYTYGLSAFGKLEMEIINSKLGLEELYDFIYNICAYVINSNVTFKDGETLGYTAEQKINITLSKGQLVDGQTLKLEM